MPSTRATELAFLVTVVFLLTPSLDRRVQSLAIFLICLCLFIKWYELEHSVNQLVMGLLLGAFTGYASVYIVTG